MSKKYVMFSVDTNQYSILIDIMKNEIITNDEKNYKKFTNILESVNNVCDNIILSPSVFNSFTKKLGLNLIVSTKKKKVYEFDE